jgi:hypothetical protein
VKLRSVTFDPQAIDDLSDIHGWVADQANDRVADQYAERLIGFCTQLDLFP